MSTGSWICVIHSFRNTITEADNKSRVRGVEWEGGQEV